MLEQEDFMYFSRLLTLCVAIGLLVGPIAAAPADETDPETLLFDRPSTVRLVSSATGADKPDGDVKCTVYPDLMIRESGVDTPAPDAASLVSPVDNQACNAARGVALKTENFSFLGRKGGFLFFDATDPNGAVPFMVLDAATGRALYSDGKTGKGVLSVAIEGGLLHLKFTRGINLSCSVVKDGAGCWSKMVKAGAIPHALAQMPPPTQLCAAQYRKTKVQADDPSVISYDVDMTLDANGKSTVTTRGAIGCEAMP